MISTLEPKPGRQYAGENTVFVVPEISVVRQGGDYVCRLNNERLPRIRISRYYRQMLETPDTPKETKDYIREKIRAGVFMIQSIHQRQKTILNIAREIVRVQREFLDHGVSHLRPLAMTDIARVLEVHETTVSRAVANKYMATPRGLFEMKYFFTPGLRTESGEDVSNKAVKDALEKLVSAEDSAHPLTDLEMTQELRKQGLKVARRTIAKYREQLHIPPSHQRRD
jgi:RNA polymerase sigma-54 factor